MYPSGGSRLICRSLAVVRQWLQMARTTRRVQASDPNAFTTVIARDICIDSEPDMTVAKESFAEYTEFDGKS